MMRREATTPVTPPGTRREGFTLLEVLVSSVILAILLILLIGMADGASRLWRDGERRREASREAREGLRIISEDLHSAVLTTNAETLMIERVPGDRERGERLFFLVSHPSERRQTGRRGDLCATGYFIAPEPGGDGLENLYRFHASGEEVSEALEQGTLRELYARASPTNTATTELLARNIVRLDVRVLPGGKQEPGTIMVALSGINGETARLISSDPGATERNERLIRRDLQRFSGIVRLPPRRDIPTGP
jgi:prepilin-type N-terminal cleavage/methylation domain-containing protein